MFEFLCRLVAPKKQSKPTSSPHTFVMIKLFLLIYDKDRGLALRLCKCTWSEACEILSAEFNLDFSEMTFPQVEGWMLENLNDD